MNLQDELSNHARSDEEIAEEKRIADLAAKQRAKEIAEIKAAEITDEIKKLLLENVHSGKYLKLYNRGIVHCYVVIPKRKYLASTKQLQVDKKTHHYIATLYRFLVKKEFAHEFEYLNQSLITWGNENNVKITWVVRYSGSTKESPFPSEEAQSYESSIVDQFCELAVKATSQFPIDPSLPIGHLTDEDREGIKKLRNTLIDMCQKDCAQKKKDWLYYRTIATLFALATIAIWCAAVHLNITGFLWPALIAAAVCFLFVVLSNEAREEYEKAKATLEEQIQKESEKGGA